MLDCSRSIFQRVGPGVSPISRGRGSFHYCRSQSTTVSECRITREGVSRVRARKLAGVLLKKRVTMCGLLEAAQLSGPARDHA